MSKIGYPTEFSILMHIAQWLLIWISPGCGVRGGRAGGGVLDFFGIDGKEPQNINVFEAAEFSYFTGGFFVDFTGVWVVRKTSL